MADIRAFRGFRYDLGHVGPLADVVAPPYDVIDPALQQQLYDRSPYNVVRIDFGKAEQTDGDESNRYTRAAGLLRDWTQNGVIKQDTARSLYVCHQEYEVEGVRHVRKGFLARVRLEKFGEGRIFPHEETMSGPKEDRLKLMRATAMNLSPVFGMYPDEAGESQDLLDNAVRRALPIEATDHLGTVSRLWPVTDQQVITRVTGLLGPKPLFIADGHHRYETALRYLDERRAAGDVANDEAAANFTLMMLVGMSDPGLLILPTHRLISGLPAMTGANLRELLAGHFEVQTVGGGDAAAGECWESIEADGSQSVLGFGTVGDGGWHIARLTNPAAMDDLAKDHSPDWRGLAVSILHVLVLNQLVTDRLRAQPQCEYVHLLREVTDAVAARRCQLAALVPPVTMGDVERISAHQEKMPPKSTYFYPKLLTGLLFNSLKSH
ncbi:MAG TPA: DUF1015 domain-containing protein [Gemmataceae bacterium]|jgi:uncharacterized protein (DUF1015 family)|nr:DUF1015 domain-containing protein [Gemmataceae bacterium]